MPIEDTYPSYSEQIRQARSAGFSDEEIQGEFQSLIREQATGGRSVAQIQKGLGQERPGFLQRLATGPVGDVLANTLEGFRQLGGNPYAITEAVQNYPEVQRQEVDQFKPIFGAVGEPLGRVAALGKAGLGALIGTFTPRIVQETLDPALRSVSQLTEEGAKAVGLPEDVSRFAGHVAPDVLMLLGPKIFERATGRAPRAQAEVEQFISENPEVVAPLRRSPEVGLRVKRAMDEGFSPDEIANELVDVTAVKPREVSVEPSARGPEFFSTLKDLGYTDEQLRTMPFADKVRRARERVPAETKVPDAEAKPAEIETTAPKTETIEPITETAAAASTAGIFEEGKVPFNQPAFAVKTADGKIAASLTARSHASLLNELRLDENTLTDGGYVVNGRFVRGLTPEAKGARDAAITNATETIIGGEKPLIANLPEPVSAPKTKRASRAKPDEDLSLSSLVKREGGIRITDDIPGELRALTKENKVASTLLRKDQTKGMTAEEMAEIAHAKGFITEPTTDALLAALRDDLAGRKVLSGSKQERVATEALDRQAIEIEADRKIAELQQTEGPLEFKGKTFESAERLPGGDLKLVDGETVVLKKADDILRVEPKPAAPTIDKTAAGDQYVIPGTEGRNVPEGALKTRRRQTEDLTDLERASLPKDQGDLLAQADEAPFDIPAGGAELEPGSLGMAGNFARRTPESIRQEAGVPFTPSRQKIISDLSSLLDVPIRYGKVQSKNVLGFFKVKPEVIRTKFAQDVEVAGHEVGHFLEKSIFKTTKEMRGGQGLTGKAFEAFADELKPIATQHNKSSSPVVEGFAEFVRRYVTHDAQARQVAPRFYKYFDELLETKHPDVRQVLLNARKDYDTYLQVPATARVRAQISRMPEKQAWSARDVAHRYYTLVVDQLHPIAQIKEQLVQGKKMSADKDPEILARTFPGWSRKADLFINKGPRSFETLEKVGPGLDEITRPIKDRWEDFWDYAAARRAIYDIQARSRAGLIQGNVEKATGVSLKDWQDTFKAYDSPLFQETFQKVQQYKSQTLDYMAKSYGIPDYQLEILKRMNENHVPFHRVMDDPNFPVERGPPSGGGTFGNQQTAIRRFKGSQRQIIDPAESTIKNTFTLVNLAERNAVAKAMVDLARQVSGAGKYVEDVPFDRKPTSFQLKEIKKTFDELGIEVDTDMLETTATIFRANKMAPENHIMFWENGKQRLVRLEPELYKAMQKLDKETTNTFVQFLKPAAEALRVGATTTPEFTMRNPLRDQWSVAINTGLGIKTPYFTAKGLFHVIKQDAMYENWLAAGGAQSSLVKLNRAEIIKRANEMGRDESTAMTLIRHPWQSVRLLSQLTEEASRLGVFEASLRGKEPTKAHLIEAGAASREGSIDFQRMGAKTQALNQITAFWNANLQGLDKVRRMAIQDPLAFATRVGVGITLPSILLTAAQMDDARWKEIPQWQKDTSWVIMTGPRVTDEEFAKMNPQQKRDLYRKTIWRIPKPFELGTVFGSIPERIIESIAGQHKGDVSKTLLQTLGTGIGSSLLPMPTMFAPLFENWANWSNFTDRNVVPKSLEDLEPALQAKAQTTAIAKKIGEAINYSPAKIDNLIRGYGGGLGILGAEAASSLMDTLGVVDLPDPPAKTGADIPGLRGFQVRFPTSQAESIETFWEKYGDSQQKVKSWKGYLKEGRNADAEKYYQANREIIERSKAYGRGAETMRAYATAVGNIWKSNDLSPEKKGDAIDQLYVEQIDAAREMLKALYPQGTR